MNDDDDVGGPSSAELEDLIDEEFERQEDLARGWQFLPLHDAVVVPWQ